MKASTMIMILRYLFYYSLWFTVHFKQGYR